MRSRFFILIYCFMVSMSLQAEQHLYKSESVSYKVEKIASGFQIPWGLSFISEYELLITERKGRLSVLNISSDKTSVISGVPEVFAEGQGGLLDVAVAPDFKTSGWVYFTYSKNITGMGATALARAKLTGNSLIQWQDLLVTKSTSDTGRHYGSRIAFDFSGHVFFGVGDRGVRPNAQNLQNHAGAIIRLNLDGSIPVDNPFVNNDQVLDEIWSYGHRNPQGLFYDAVDNRLWEIEHGPRGGDEINLIEKGKNYGWPIISYGKEYWGPVAVGEGTHKTGMQQPVKQYTPSIAPGSLIVYRSKAVQDWDGNLFSGALKLQHINRIVIKQNKAVFEERLLQGMGERIRALVQGPDNTIYFSTDSGKIFRLTPTKTMP